MKASRLLSILLLLQARGRMTAQALADEFEVSVRTVYRDVDQLSAAGVPVYAEKGPHGGFQLLDGYRTRLTGLDAREAETMLLAGLPGPAADLGLGEALGRARLKLLAALPAASREEAERVERRFHLDPIAWFQRADITAHLRDVAKATWESRRIRIRYDSWKQIVTREIEPLGLILKAGLWYCAARVEGQIRVYRVASILGLEGTEQDFEYPAGFDLAAHWRAWAADYEARMQQGRAVIRISPDGLRMLSRASHGLSEALAIAGPPDREGWRRAAIPIESIEAAAAALLAYPGQIEVLDPPALRAAVRAGAEAVLALHRAD